MDPLAKIYGCAEKAIEACDSALGNVIPTDSEEFKRAFYIFERALKELNVL